MLLTNQFTIPVPPEAAWILLTDVERVAACMPGATLTYLEGDTFKGIIKIKVGPINAVFQGQAQLTKDDLNKTAIILVSGEDTKGQGFAKGTITAKIVPAVVGSMVTFETNVMITGRMASFGRSSMTDISDQLFAQFVSCVKRDLLGG